MEIEVIQEELEGLGYQICSIARMYRAQNGEIIHMPLVLVQHPKTATSKNKHATSLKLVTSKFK